MIIDNELLQNSDSEIYICLEINSQEGCLRFSNRPLEEEGKFWDPLIENSSLLVTREMDLDTQQISLSNVQVTLNNRLEEDGCSYFARLMDSGLELENCLAIIYLKMRTPSGLAEMQVFSGICSPVSMTDTCFSLEIKSSLESRLGILQRQVNDIDFPQAPDDSIGKGMNLILGESANGKTGTVQLIPIQADGGAITLAIAQHRITSLQKLFRRRNGQYQQLLSGYNVLELDHDAKGHEIATVAVLQGHQTGDEYFADVRGFPGSGEVLVGAGDYFSRGYEEFVDLVNGSDPFTIELSFIAQRENVEETLISRDGQAGQRGWRLFKTSGNKIALDLSGDGVQVATCTAQENILFASQVNIVRVVVSPGESLEINLNDEAATLNWNGQLPASIFTPDVPLYIGRGSATGDSYQGKLQYCLLARGSQPGNNYRQDALEDIISEWLFSHDGADLQGRNPLTLHGSPQFNCLTHEANPALTFRHVLLCNDGITSYDIDETSIAEAAQLCDDLNLSGQSVHGGVIPGSPGQLNQNTDRSAILLELARNFGHNMVPQASGKIGLKRISVPEGAADEEMVHYSWADGQLQDAFITIDFNPLKRANEVRALLRNSHASQGNHEGYVRAYNLVSQDLYGKAEQQWNYSFQRDTEALEAVLTPRISLSSGRTRLISFSVPGFLGLQQGSDVGDVIRVTAPGVYGNFKAKKIMITSRTVDLINGGTEIKGLTLESSVGVVAFSSEETVIIPASASTFIGATEIPCGNKSFPDADANASYGHLDYLMHGHHYAQSGVCVNSQYGYGNINWITFFQWSFNVSAWGNRTVKNISVVINIEDHPELRCEYEGEQLTRSNWNGSGIYLSNFLLSSVNKSYNSFLEDAMGNINNLYSSEIGFVGNGTGEICVPLNSYGVTGFEEASKGDYKGGNSIAVIMGINSSGDNTNALRVSSCNKHDKIPYAIITYVK